MVSAVMVEACALTTSSVANVIVSADVTVDAHVAVPVVDAGRVTRLKAKASSSPPVATNIVCESSGATTRLLIVLWWILLHDGRPMPSPTLLYEAS